MSRSSRAAIVSIGVIGFAILSLTAEPALAQSRPPTDIPSTPSTQGGSIEHPRNFFLRHLLVDSMWLPTESGNHMVGLIGGHLAIANVGRVYIYGPPGVIVLRSAGNTQTAYTWGFSLQLTEFNVPGTRRRAVLFLSLAKCWTYGDQRIGRNIGGLSFAWKR